MKKLFCDCCGEEISDKKDYTIVSVIHSVSDDDKMNIIDDSTYNSYDLCKGCGKRFEIMFKNWREFK